MFRFSLHGVLDHRSAVEEICQREHAMAVEYLNRLKSRKSHLAEQHEESHRVLQEGIKQGIGQAHTRLHNDCMTWARRDIEQLEEAMTQQREKIESKRIALVDAAKNRKILEKLQEREHEEHKRDEAKSEQKMFDDLAIRQFNTR